MSRIYKGSNVRTQQMRAARKGPHWAAQHPPEKELTFVEGEKVRVRGTGEETIVIEKGQYGYVLQGHDANKFFPASVLEKL